VQLAHHLNLVQWPSYADAALTAVPLREAAAEGVVGVIDLIFSILDETNELCACFASDLPSGTIVEQLDGDFLPAFQSTRTHITLFNIRT
jgi:hypothetical protein